MADVFSAKKRSEVMSRICGSNTVPELTIRRLLWAGGYRYRINARVEGCKPDLVFRSCHLAVFVDGCFWHGCPTHYSSPVGNGAFWRAKLAENTARDLSFSRRGLIIFAAAAFAGYLAHQWNLYPGTQLRVSAVLLMRPVKTAHPGH